VISYEEQVGIVENIKGWNLGLEGMT